MEVWQSKERAERALKIELIALHIVKFMEMCVIICGVIADYLSIWLVIVSCRAALYVGGWLHVSRDRERERERDNNWPRNEAFVTQKTTWPSSNNERDEICIFIVDWTFFFAFFVSLLTMCKGGTRVSSAQVDSTHKPHIIEGSSHSDVENTSHYNEIEHDSERNEMDRARGRCGSALSRTLLCFLYFPILNVLSFIFLDLNIYIRVHNFVDEVYLAHRAREQRAMRLINEPSGEQPTRQKRRRK